MSGTIIRKPLDILPLVKRYTNSRQENFLVFTLNGGNQVIKVHHVSKGIVNKTIVHPRECFFPAIKDNAVAVLFAHNHPSGFVTPSGDDVEITKRLCMAGKLLGFYVLDHIIFSKHLYHSLREHGIITDEECSQSELEHMLQGFPLINGK